MGPSYQLAVGERIGDLVLTEPCMHGGDGTLTQMAEMFQTPAGFDTKHPVQSGNSFI